MSPVFRPACGRKNYVSFLCCLGQEDILYDKEIKFVKGVGDVVRVRVSYHWVFTHDVKCLEFSFSRSFHHGRDRESDLALFWDLASPKSFDLFSCCGETDLKVAGECCGKAPHVACTLYVVLSAERVYACSRTAQHSAEKGQVAAAADVVGAVVCCVMPIV